MQKSKETCTDISEKSEMKVCVKLTQCPETFSLLSPTHRVRIPLGSDWPSSSHAHTLPGQTLHDLWHCVHLAVDAPTPQILSLSSQATCGMLHRCPRGPHTQPFQSGTHSPSPPCKPTSPGGMLSRMSRLAMQSLKQILFLTPCSHPWPHLSL